MGIYVLVIALIKGLTEKVAQAGRVLGGVDGSVL